MKKFLFSLIVFYSAQSAFAQTEKPIVLDSSAPRLQQQLLFPNRIINKTDKGTVYALPQDNMPVLVPDSTASKMPVALKSNQSHSMMPNPYYPRKPLLKKTDSLQNKIPLNRYQYKPNPAIRKSLNKQ
ncbi:MAG: hypothetical protein GXC73_07875 [Chitinophagaceae bacterium]|nr:hypothetical protein [Chitinophagaceae bacterium]